MHGVKVWRSAMQSAAWVIALGAMPAWAVAEDDALATDRPDFVEAGSVVGKGVVQVETSIAHEVDRQSGSKLSTLTTPTLLRFGVSRTLELRAETDGYTRQKVSGAGGAASASGMADTSLGLKWAAREGDPASRTPALAVLFHVDTRSGASAFRGSSEVPSLRVVAEWELADDAGFGVMPGAAYSENERGERYWSGILGATYSRPLAARLRGFVELAGRELRSTANGGNIVTFDTGVTYAIDRDTQIDCAAVVGLNRHTPDLALTIGFSRRFR